VAEAVRLNLAEVSPRVAALTIAITAMTAPDSEPRTAPMTVSNVQQVSESFETLTSHSRENPSLIDATASNVENFTPF
jgi:hypothetical protein